MRKAVLILLIILSFTSCEFVMDRGITPDAKIYILAMGINYDHCNINTLCAQNDAKGFANQMAYILDGKAEYEIITYTDEVSGFELNRISTSGKEVIKNFGSARMTKEEIISSLISPSIFSDEMNENDLFILFYGGHGDGNNNKAGDLALSYTYGTSSYTGLSTRDLYDSALPPFKARTLVILDSCFSGNFIEEGDLESLYKYSESNDYLIGYDISGTISTSISVMFEKNDSTIAKSYVLAASSARQEAQESKERKHGYFSYALLKYLDYDLENGEARYTAKFDRSLITVASLYNSILDNMAKSEKIISTPNMTNSRLDMVIFDFR